MKVTGAVALPAFWLPAAATLLHPALLLPLLLPLPLLLQTRAWHCLTALYP